MNNPWALKRRIRKLERRLAELEKDRAEQPRIATVISSISATEGYRTGVIAKALRLPDPHEKVC